MGRERRTCSSSGNNLTSFRRRDNFRRVTADEKQKNPNRVDGDREASEGKGRKEKACTRARARKKESGVTQRFREIETRAEELRDNLNRR